MGKIIKKFGELAIGDFFHCTVIYYQQFEKISESAARNHLGLIKKFKTDRPVTVD